MTIQQLIEKLKKHPNPNAEIEWKVNLSNPDDVEDDILGEIEIFNEDDFYPNFLEILVIKKGSDSDHFPAITKNTLKIQHNEKTNTKP